MIVTDRLVLRAWTDADRAPFAAMNADPVVMHDFPAPLTRDESDAKLARYQAVHDRLGYSRWALQRREDGQFLGYVGVLPVADHYPLAARLEIGWRMVRAAWGHGYASEGTRAALRDAFERTGAREIVAFTAPSNSRSRAVMARVGMTHDPARDFDLPGAGRFVVYAACPATFPDPGGSI